LSFDLDPDFDPDLDPDLGGGALLNLG